MSNIGFCGTLSFIHDRASNEDIIAVMRDLTLFKPTAFRSSLKSFKRLGSNNFWEQVRSNLEQNEYFRSYAKRFAQNPIRLDHISISFFPTTNIIQIRFILSDENMNILKQLESVISLFSQKHIILSASIRTIGEYDWNDNNDLELQKRNHQEIDMIQTIQIAYKDYADTRQFSGHTNEYEGLWFGCSYEMWFGIDYEQYIPLIKISGFQECEHNSMYDNETVHIVMFKTPYDFKSISSMKKSFMFRKITDCDKVFDYWKDKIRNQSIAQGNFHTEIEKGVFSHGGVRLIKSYLDANEQPVTKSQAVKVHISERGTHGQIIYEEIIDA